MCIRDRLKPADGIDGVKNAILTAVKDAGPNACPPMVVGVGAVSYTHLDVYKRQVLLFLSKKVTKSRSL